MKNCKRVMGSNRCILILSVLLVGQSLVLPVNGKEQKGAYFTEVDYPKSKIYQAGDGVWRFPMSITVYNVNCSTDTSGRGLFFLKIYEDGKLSWNEYRNTTYKHWRCDIGSTRKIEWLAEIPTWKGPKSPEFKVELYWNCGGESYLQDSTSFTVDFLLFIDPHPPFRLTELSYLLVYLFLTALLVFRLSLVGPLETRKT